VIVTPGELRDRPHQQLPNPAGAHHQELVQAALSSLRCAIGTASRGTRTAVATRWASPGRAFAHGNAIAAGVDIVLPTTLWAKTAVESLTKLAADVYEPMTHWNVIGRLTRDSSSHRADLYPKLACYRTNTYLFITFTVLFFT